MKNYSKDSVLVIDLDGTLIDENTMDLAFKCNGVLVRLLMLTLRFVNLIPKRVFKIDLLYVLFGSASVFLNLKINNNVSYNSNVIKYAQEFDGEVYVISRTPQGIVQRFSKGFPAIGLNRNTLRIGGISFNKYEIIKHFMPNSTKVYLITDSVDDHDSRFHIIKDEKLQTVTSGQCRGHR